MFNMHTKWVCLGEYAEMMKTQKAKRHYFGRSCVLRLQRLQPHLAWPMPAHPKYVSRCVCSTKRAELSIFIKCVVGCAFAGCTVFGSWDKYLSSWCSCSSISPVYFDIRPLSLSPFSHLKSLKSIPVNSQAHKRTQRRRSILNGARLLSIFYRNRSDVREIELCSIRVTGKNGNNGKKINESFWDPWRIKEFRLQ